MWIENRYRVIEVLGEGGMGIVYLVEDRFDQGSKLALKTLHPAHFESGMVSYFLKEYESLAQLSHPNLARVHDFGFIKEQGKLFFTMEYLSGVNLYQATHSGERERILELFVQVCRGLEYIHSRGFVHLDIKPENVMVVERNHAKIMDFGLARQASGRPTRNLRGTLSYIAPELVAGAPIDRRADLYSLGILLFKILQRTLPLAIRAEQDLYMGVIPMPPRPEEITGEEPFRTLILGLTHLRPEDRYDSANHVIEAVNSLTGRAYELETKDTARSYILSSPLVGREVERNRLAETFERFESGGCPARAILISGEPGIGKSRLVRELRISRQIAGDLFFSGNCYEDAARAYSPIVDILKEILGHIGAGHPLTRRYAWALDRLIPGFFADVDVDGSDSSRDDPRGERLRLLEDLSAFLIGVARRKPTILSLADLHWADRATCDLLLYLVRALREPEPSESVEVVRDERVLAPTRPFPAPDPFSIETRDETAELIAECTRELAAATREDSSTILYEDPSLPEEPSGPPRLLLLASLRPEEIQGTPAAELVDALWAEEKQEIALRRFGRADVSRFIGCMVGAQEGPEELSRRLVEVTEGNPFFIEEVLKTLLEEGRIAKGDGEWIARIDLSEIEIPGTCEEVLERRLAKLPAEEIRLLEVLALAARPLPREILLPLAGSLDLDAPAIVRQLTAKGILMECGMRNAECGMKKKEDEGGGRRSSFTRIPGSAPDEREARLVPDDAKRTTAGDGAVLAFYHSACMQVLARRMRAESRLRLHRQFARTLEDLYSGREEEVLDDLAHHYLKSRDPRGIDYGLRAADRNRRSFANEKAISLYRQVIELSPPAPIRLGATERLGEVLTLVGDHEAAETEYRKALEAAPAVADRARLLCSIAKVQERKGEFEGALASSNGALALVGNDGPADVRAGVLVQIGRIMELQGAYEQGLFHARAAIELARPDRDLWEKMGSAHSLLGNLLSCLGKASEALEAYREGLALHEERGDLYGMAMLLNNIANVHQDLGENDRAIELYNRALSLFSRIGHPSGKALCFSNLGIVYEQSGQFETARDYHAMALAILEKVGDPTGIARTSECLAAALGHLGDWAASERHHRRTLSICSQIGNVPLSVYACINLANDYLRMSVVSDAERFARTGVVLARDIRSPLLTGVALVLTGEVHRRRGQVEAALSAIREGLAELEAIGAQSEAALAHVTLGHVFLEIGEHESAARHLERAHAVVGEQGNRSLLARCLWLAGENARRTGQFELARDRLERARELASQLDDLGLLWAVSHDLGRLSRLTQHFVQARAYFEEALQAAEKLWSRIPAAYRARFLEDPRHRQLEADVEALRNDGGTWEMT